jgi:hypothetical protein
MLIDAWVEECQYPHARMEANTTEVTRNTFKIARILVPYAERTGGLTRPSE